MPTESELIEVQRAAAKLSEALGNFPTLISRYLEVSGVAPSTFGGRACANRNFVQQLHNRRNFRILTILRVCEYIENVNALID